MNDCTKDNALTVREAPRGDELLLAARLDPKAYRRLSSYDIAEAVELMTPIVAMAYNYRGQNTTTGGITVIASALVDELMRDEYGTAAVSFEEIREVVRRHVLTAEEFYVSVSSLYRVVVDYAKGLGSQLQHKAAEIRRQEKQAVLRDSVVGAMVGAYTGELYKNIKSKQK